MSIVNVYATSHGYRRRLFATARLF
jgi:hypothetical protein